MSKKILIIGSTLYSLCLAYNLSKNKKNKIFVISEKKKILPSFDHIEINKFKINNGFHALDLPRCRDLLNFLIKIKIKFKIKKKIHKILIDRNILNLYESIKSWPFQISKNLKKNFLLTKNFNYSDVAKGSLLKKFKICSKRYGLKPNESKRFFIPWFLPKEYTFKSIDEGAKFREKVKNNKVEYKYAIPRNLLFSSLQNAFKKFFIKKKNIYFFYRSKLDFKNQLIYLDNQSKDNPIRLNLFKKIFYGDSFVSLLFFAKPSHLKKIVCNKKFLINILISVNKELKFTEMICLNKNIYYLNRISVFKKFKNKTILQLEIFSDSQNINNYELIKLIKEIAFIFKLKTPPDLIGYKDSRVIYHFNDKWKLGAINAVRNWIKLNNLLIKVNYDYDGPINMSKAWLFAKKDAL